MNRALSTVAASARPSRAGAAPRLVPAVERCVRVLDALSEARAPLALSDLARALGMPKSSAHGLLATLAALGVVRREGDGAFTLGDRPLAWAGARLDGSGLVPAFEAEADALPRLAPETVMLASLDGADVVYLACRQGTRPLAVNFRVGGRFPASVTASGKAMLATLDAARVEALFDGRPLPRLTRQSLATLPALRESLARARRQRIAIDDEETADGMLCLGAPVFGARGGEAIAAVAVSVIKAAAGPKLRTELTAAVRTLAERVSARLGHRAVA